jgi:hypothetical protein
MASSTNMGAEISATVRYASLVIVKSSSHILLRRARVATLKMRATVN